MKKIICRKNKHLLEHAKNVFGEELVTNAWDVISWTENADEHCIIEKVNKLKEIENLLYVDFEFDYSSNILVEFSSGKMVSFSTSEHASATDIMIEILEVE